MNPREITLLIVDDDADMREVIADDFRKHGFNILMASNGKDAFEIIKNQRVDLVFSDVHMPSLDGIELFRKVKQECRPTPIVIFITACSSAIKRELAKMGAICIFSKPFDRKKVYEKVIELLDC